MGVSVGIVGTPLAGVLAFAAYDSGSDAGLAVFPYAAIFESIPVILIPALLLQYAVYGLILGFAASRGRNTFSLTGIALIILHLVAAIAAFASV